MLFYSTNNPNLRASLSEALFRGLPSDNGLYMPNHLDPLPSSFFEELPNLSFPEIGYRVSRQLLGDALPHHELQRIVTEAINFPAPLRELEEKRHVLELFHGPSLAFKDFGARFMSQLMSYFNQGEKQQLVILVATSGDTGGAVAAGFFKIPGIEVVILYPKGKVSYLQEKQLTTLGENIHALEINGTFDDCQAIVKQAFLDESLRASVRLSSANSINISRLIPQSFYYFEAYKQLTEGNKKQVVFSVPSGNFGNLTAGLIAHRLGLPVYQFLAATNKNDVVPTYLASGQYNTRPSQPTIANAMDVGNPSNFARMANLYGHVNGLNPLQITTHGKMSKLITGYAYTDPEIEAALKHLDSTCNYIIDPHGAIGYLALEAYQKQHPHTHGIVLETAHPSKFKPDVEKILGREIEVPLALAKLADLPKHSIEFGIDYAPIREWLLSKY